MSVDRPDTMPAASGHVTRCPTARHPDRLACTQPAVRLTLRRLQCALLSVLVALAAGCSALPAAQPASPPGVRPGGGPTPRLGGPFRIPDAGSAVAATGDTNGLWLAAAPPANRLAAQPGAGQLQRIDPDSPAVVDQWPVGGAPVAVAAAGGNIWVADGPGMGPAAAAGANQVLQFTPAGQLVTSSPVTNPLAVVADGSDAAVAYQQASGIYLQRLSGGTADPAVKLAAGRNLGVSVTWCADHRLWAASYDDRAQQLHLQQFVAVAGQPLRDLHSDTVLAASGTTTLACQPRGLAVLVAELDHATVFLVSRDTPASSPRTATVALAGALVGDGAGRLWLVRNHAYPSRVEVEMLNPDDLTVGPAVSFPGAARLYAAAPAGIWVADQDPSASQTAIVTNITTP